MSKQTIVISLTAVIILAIIAGWMVMSPGAKGLPGSAVLEPQVAKTDAVKTQLGFANYLPSTMTQYLALKNMGSLFQQIIASEAIKQFKRSGLWAQLSNSLTSLPPFISDPETQGVVKDLLSQEITFSYPADTADTFIQLLVTIMQGGLAGLEQMALKMHISSSPQQFQQALDKTLNDLYQVKIPAFILSCHPGNCTMYLAKLTKLQENPPPPLQQKLSLYKENGLCFHRFRLTGKELVEQQWQAIQQQLQAFLNPEQTERIKNWVSQLELNIFIGEVKGHLVLALGPDCKIVQLIASQVKAGTASSLAMSDKFQYHRGHIGTTPLMLLYADSRRALKLFQSKMLPLLEKLQQDHYIDIMNKLLPTARTGMPPRHVAQQRKMRKLQLQLKLARMVEALKYIVKAAPAEHAVVMNLKHGLQAFSRARMRTHTSTKQASGAMGLPLVTPRDAILFSGMTIGKPCNILDVVSYKQGYDEKAFVDELSSNLPIPPSLHDKIVDLLRVLNRQLPRAFKEEMALVITGNGELQRPGASTLPIPEIALICKVHKKQLKECVQRIFDSLQALLKEASHGRAQPIPAPEAKQEKGIEFYTYSQMNGMIEQMAGKGDLNPSVAFYKDFMIISTSQRLVKRIVHLVKKGGKSLINTRAYHRAQSLIHPQACSFTLINPQKGLDYLDRFFKVRGPWQRLQRPVMTFFNLLRGWESIGGMGVKTSNYHYIHSWIITTKTKK